MAYVWDVNKSEKNRLERDRSFEDAWLILEGTFKPIQKRSILGEVRWELWGFIGTRPWLLVLKVESDGNLRVISLRKANKRERRKHYGEI
jgi:uncharacterized DUF497 family protein